MTLAQQSLCIGSLGVGELCPIQITILTSRMGGLTLHRIILFRRPSSSMVECSQYDLTTIATRGSGYDRKDGHAPPHKLDGPTQSGGRGLGVLFVIVCIVIPAGVVSIVVSLLCSIFETPLAETLTVPRLIAWFPTR